MNANERRADEDARLQRLEDFERLKFIPWIEWMAAAAELSPANILAVLGYAVTSPLVLDFREDSKTSCSYRKWNRFIGHTPIETAEMMFTADHWHAHKPIPEREIIWNPEWGGKRADIFRSTHQYLQDITKLKLEL